LRVSGLASIGKQAYHRSVPQSPLAGKGRARRGPALRIDRSLSDRHSSPAVSHRSITDRFI
jgi:hypothetical protein